MSWALLDSAYEPTTADVAKAHAASVGGWAGYLNSPTAYHPWRPGALRAICVGGLGVLPVWVAPLGASSAAHGASDALAALAQVHAAGLTPVVALDTEKAAERAPGALAYAEGFHGTLNTHGALTVQYGSPVFLAQLARVPAGNRPRSAWLASWGGTRAPDLATAWPLRGEWVGIDQRGWQWAGPARRAGMTTTTDLSVMSAEFPLARILAAKPTRALVTFADGTRAAGPLPYTVHLS